MNKFDSETVIAMRAVLEEVCRHLPSNSTSARAFIASRILERASGGERTYCALLEAGRRAVIDQFGTVQAVRKVFP